MKKLKRFIVLLLFIIAGINVSASAQISSAVKQNIQQRLDEGNILGISIAFIKPDGHVIYYSKGYLSTKRQQQINKNTIFEIGSVSKTFTSLILARMVLQHKVSLDDPISKFLPDSLHLPFDHGQKISLEELAAHTSGLPRMPSNFNPQVPLNPYAGYTVHDLYKFLDHYKLTRKPGTHFLYSNLGVGLLGVILSKASGLTYAQLLHKYITGPLKMNDTGLKVPKAKQNRFADPYFYGRPVQHWDWKSLVGAGGIRSTAKDLVTYMKAQMGLIETPIDSAIALTHKIRFRINKNRAVSLSWAEFTAADTIIWKNGGTGGFRSFVGFNKGNGTGVVVLSSSRDYNIDDIGLHLLNQDIPLHKVKRSVKISPKILKKYVGTYENRFGTKYYVSRKRDQLWVRISGQNKYKIYPKSKKRFFYKVTSGEIVFSSIDSSGFAQKLTLYQSGLKIKAARVSGKNALPKHRIIEVSPEILKKYTGTYEFSPSFDITITQKGDQLFAQATGQPKFKIYPESKTQFFLKVVNAELEFVANQNGNFTTLKLYQNGRVLKGYEVNDEK